MFRLLLLIAALLGMSSVGSAHAQIGKFLREGAEFAGKKLLTEGAQEVAEAGGKKLLREAAEETSEQLLKRSGQAAARYSDDAIKAIAKHGDSLTPLITAFGDDAARAATSVTGRNARRLAMLSEELATSPQGAEAMALIAKGGKADQIVEFLWSHRGKIAATGVLAALLANTDAVLAAGVEVSTVAMETAGDAVLEPLVREAAPSLWWVIPLGAALMVLGPLLALIVGAVYLWCKHGWFRQSLSQLLCRMSLSRCR